ncbi:putative armadillo-like helical protein [Arabidopsis thaliana]
MANHNSFTYMDHSFSDISLNFDSSAFSDCNSDISCEFPTTTSESRQRKLFLSCAVDNSDDVIRNLITHLESSSSIEEQKQAAMEIRLLSKNKPENRIKLAKAGAIKPLVSLISSSDLQLQEYGVTAVLNLSLCDENKEMIVSSGAVKPLVNALRLGTPTTKENAACALLRLSQVEENKITIGRSGAIPLLVNLLENGGFRAKKDASTALYSLCSTNENKTRAVESGIMKPLPAVVEEGGVPVLVEIVEAGTQRQKEISVSILLQLCEESVVYRTMVAREGAVPPLVALSQGSASRGAKVKAEALIELLRQPRQQQQQQQHFESNDNER